MRLIKDIWAVVKNIWPTWKMQRYLSRVERNLKRMEKKHGVIGTFIKLLEETIARVKNPATGTIKLITVSNTPRSKGSYDEVKSSVRKVFRKEGESL